MKYKVGDKIILRDLHNYDLSLINVHSKRGYIIVNNIAPCDESCSERCPRKMYYFVDDLDGPSDGWCAKNINKSAKLYRIIIKKPAKFKLKRRAKNILDGTGLAPNPILANIIQNMLQPPTHVNHRDLTRVGDSEFRSQCPMCADGILPVIRNFTTHKLQKNDVCLLCGRRFIYDDIKENVQLKYKPNEV